MSNEKHDEFSSWRSLLGSRDALPEYGLDSRDRAWEKLTRRLQPQPATRRDLLQAGSTDRKRPAARRYFVYWMAAACFLIALIPATLLRRIPTRMVTAPGPAQANAPAVRPPLRPAEDDIVFRSIPPPGDRTHRTPGSRDGLAVTTLHTEPPTRRMAGSATPPRPTVTPTLAPAMPPIAEVPAAPQQNPQIAGTLLEDSQHKSLEIKQLKVVHINEIDNTSHSGPAVTSTSRNNGEPDIKVLILLKTRQ